MGQLQGIEVSIFLENFKILLMKCLKSTLNALKDLSVLRSKHVNSVNKEFTV